MAENVDMLEFRNSLPIIISLKDAKIYKDTSVCNDENLLVNPHKWHQIVIEHNDIDAAAAAEEPEMELQNRKQIIARLFAQVKDEQFYPIGYRFGLQSDRFLVRDCALALKRLFANGLRVNDGKGGFIKLQVHLNVATYEFGQISPFTAIAMALNRLFDELETINGKRGILNASNFAARDDLKEIILDLSNKFVLASICNMIVKNDSKFHMLRGLSFANNNIVDLEAFRVFANCKFSLLDLTNNQIPYNQQVIRTLQHIQVHEIWFENNPLTASTAYPACLEPVLKNFKFVDGIKSQDLLQQYVRKTTVAASAKTELALADEVQLTAYRIDRTNSDHIEKFEHSPQWHAIVIPDLQEQYSKDDIIFYLFLRVSAELDEFYPCYYKLDNCEHKFLVRQCFEQLKYLVLKAKLQLFMPNLLNSETETIKFHLNMNVCQFEEGQIEPSVCIERALRKRIGADGRLFNLDDFQNTPGLEDIVVHMSFTPVLTRIFTIMAQQPEFSKCTQLVLASNRILNVNSIREFAFLMQTITSVNLASNWIYQLDDIEGLTALKNLKHLVLNGNAVCKKYDLAVDYINDVKNYLPCLQTLDYSNITNQTLNQKRNFIADVSKYDLVEQFITRYFKTYDSDKRNVLKGVYNDKAIFSLMTDFDNNLCMNANLMTHLSIYMNYACASVENSNAIHYIGSEEIMQVLLQLPNTKHDLVDFHTEVQVHKNLIIMHIHGCFMDLFDSQELLLAFSRHFVLKPVRTNVTGSIQSYQIINEHLKIYLPDENKKKFAFRIIKSIDTDDIEKQLERKRIFMAMLQELTNLKTVWITRILEDAEWNFEQALKTFTVKCQTKEIPDSAFLKE